MTDFGGKLRRARERRGVSLRQISASTKISIGALEALERNDTSKLPGGIFSRAFVRSYAIEVGLDPDETVREFLELFYGEPPPAIAVPARVTEEESSFETQQRIASVLLKLIVISLPLVGVILYFTLRSRPAAVVPLPPTQRTQEVAPAAAPATQRPPPSGTSGVAHPAVPPPARPAEPPGAPPPMVEASEPLKLELHPVGPCWVTLTVDGLQVVSRLMQAGERVVHEVREEAVVEVGDAGAFAFTINGRAGRSLGAAGQVRKARITPATAAEYLAR
jgi:cytoskeleton protein RodZ